MTFYINYLNYAGFNKSAEPSVVGQGFTSSGGETTGAAYDLVDGHNNKLITIDTDGEATDFSIDFDLTNNITTADFSILDNANIQTALSDIRLTYNGGATELTSPTYLGGSLGSDLSELAVSTNWVLADEGSGSDDLFLVVFTAATDNNWEWNFRDFEGANFGADVTLGDIAIGKSFTPSVKPNIGKLRSVNYGSYFQESGGGSRYGFKNYGKRRAWTLRFTYLTDADRTSFETMWEVTDGKRYPFYADLNVSSTYTIYKVRFLNEKLDFQEIPGGRWNLTINIEEDIN